jgi:hypothetical protein
MHYYLKRGVTGIFLVASDDLGKYDIQIKKTTNVLYVQ